MGESIVEGTLTKCSKSRRSRERDDRCSRFSTDKVDTGNSVAAAGTLSEVLVEEGKTVGINTVVATDRRHGGNGARPAAAAKQAAPVHLARKSEAAARRVHTASGR